VSPEFHHWHHSAERDAHDRNFASLVASWDVLFGTVFLPKGRQPLHYGIDEHVPAGWIGRFFHPFRARPDDARVDVAAHSQDITNHGAAPVTR
jgi:sterol desaturase/sphingolipid hydroxylase (fatty acid hydroxylase superfamily)